MRSLKSVLGSILILLATVVVAFSQDFEEDNKVNEVVEQANNILRKYGIKTPNVQLNPEGKLVLAGVFDTYDEFLYALMLMNINFGFDKVKPIYDVRLVVVKKTPTELCFPYVVRGEECPYGRFSIQKTVDKRGSKGGRYALVIGVSHFANRNISEVDGADQDAISFAEYLKSGGYEVKLLVNEEATVKNVRQAISELYSKMSDGDTLVVFAASHGAPVDESGEVGIVLYDSSAEGSKRYCMVEPPVKDSHSDAALKMCTLVKNALSIREHIVNTFADKKINLVVMLDACYSGDALKSYVGMGVPYQIATTQEYERSLRHAPNLSIMATAASGDRMSWGGDVQGEFRERLLTFSGGSPRAIKLVDAGSSASTSRRAIAIEGGGTKGGNKTTPASREAQHTSKTSQAHGVFTAFLLEGLYKSGNSLAKAYELAKDDINYVSSKMCEMQKATQSQYKDYKCPPGGQNPMLFRVRTEDYIFWR